MTQQNIVRMSFALFVTGILWGVYTLVVYIGVPIHQLVYASSDAMRAMDASCGTDATVSVYLCRGALSFLPFVLAFFQMGSPFLAYAVVCGLIYAGLLLWNGYKTGYFQLQMHIRPIVFVGGFFLAVWILASTLSLGSLYNAKTPDGQRITDENGSPMLPPFRRFYEPLPQVYGGVGPEGLAELQANYKELLDGECLTEIGTTQNGARVYDMHFVCMQKGFFARAGTQFLLVVLFLLNILSLGRLILRKALRIDVVQPLLHLTFSAGLGALAWVVILWTLGVFGLLQMTLIRAFFFGMPLLLFTETRWWITASMQPTIEIRSSWKNLFPILAWLLVTYLALNFLNVVRPFPIGWDDLGSYLNRPRLLASYGGFIPSMSPFQWEYLSSLGFLLFGFDSWHAATFAMEINWAAGLLAVLAIYAFARTYLGKGRGIVAAMCYYFLPMTGHFSFADMKIDNAVFFASAVAVLATFVALLPAAEEEKPALSPKAFLVAGLMAGFAFAIKPTAVLSLLLVLSVMSGVFLGPLGFTGMTIVGFSVLQHFGALDVTGVASRAALGFSLSKTMFFVTTLLIGLGFMGFGMYRQKVNYRTVLASFGFLVLGLMIAILPWMFHNAWVKGDVIPRGVILSAPDLATPQVFYQQKDQSVTWNLSPSIPTRFLPTELKLDENHAACKGSARTEELDRYWGFNIGISHYLTLPWRQVMNIDTFGYYVTLVPALLLFPLLLLLPTFWMKEKRWLRFLFAGTFVFFAQWALVANGIPWYGIGMFLGFAVILEAFIVYAPDTMNRSLFAFLLTMSLLVCFVNRFWQFDTQKNIFEYPLGKVTASALREVTIPHYDDIRASVLQRHATLPETPYTYRIGTFISYFIPKNREILPLADHQMGFFNCLNQERDHALTLKRLIALGFNSIIFDTNTQTIEKDPNGSLHQKVNAFLDFANDPALALEIPVHDPANGIAYILLPVTAP